MWTFAHREVLFASLVYGHAFRQLIRGSMDGEYNLFFALILSFMPAINVEAQVDGRGPRQ